MKRASWTGDFHNWEAIKTLPEYNSEVKSFVVKNKSFFEVGNQAAQSLMVVLENIRLKYVCKAMKKNKTNQDPNRQAKLQFNAQNYNAVKALSQEIHNVANTLGSDYCKQVIEYLEGQGRYENNIPSPTSNEIESSISIRDFFMDEPANDMDLMDLDLSDLAFPEPIIPECIVFQQPIVEALVQKIKKFETQEKYLDLDYKKASIPQPLSREDLSHEICHEIRDLLNLINHENSTLEAKQMAREFIELIVSSINKHNLIISIQPNKKGKRIIQTEHIIDAEITLIFLEEMIKSAVPVLNMCLLNQDNCVPGRVSFNKPYEFKKLNGNLFGAELKLHIPYTPESLEKNSLRKMKCIKEENFWIRFSLYFYLHGLEEPIELIGKSLPLKIIVNKTQKISSFPTLVFDNATQTFDETVENRYKKLVRFQTLIIAIQTHFPNLKIICENDFCEIIRILYPRFFGDSINKNSLQKLVNFDSFREGVLLSGLKIVKTVKKNGVSVSLILDKISFWEWIYYLDKYIKKYLNDPLIKKNTVGYLSPDSSRQLLEYSKNGTFLIRFSNSTPNAISVEWIDQTRWCCYRATEKDLSMLPLMNRIKDTDDWKILLSRNYPLGIRKEDVFSGNQDENKRSQSIMAKDHPQSPRRLPNFIKYIPAKLRMYFFDNNRSNE